MKRILLILTLAGFTACSSFSPKDIAFNDITKVESKGMTLSQARVNTFVDITNNSRHKITLKEADFKISDDKGEILHIKIVDKVILPKKFKGDIPLNIQVKALGSLGFIGSLPRLNENCLVTGIIHAKSGIVSSKMIFENKPLYLILQQLGIDNLDSLKI